MNQNYVNFNAIFLCQEWKDLYTFKSWFDIFSDSFLFLISKVCSIQINYHFSMMKNQPFFTLFAFIIAQFFFARIKITKIFLKVLFIPDKIVLKTERHILGIATKNCRVGMGRSSEIQKLIIFKHQRYSNYEITRSVWNNILN